MNSQHTRADIFTSLLWKWLERVGVQGVQLIVQIVLARLLSPKDFGVIAIIMVFITLAHVFVESGLSTALIQKKHADEEDFSSVFYLSLTVALVLYTMIFLSARTISLFYREPMLSPLLKILAISLFFGAFNSIQHAYIARNMMFKRLFLSSIRAILISGVLGIVAAFMGFGVWALVIQQLTNQAIVTMILFFSVNWRPRLTFSYKRAKLLFSFGWKLLLSSLLNVLYMDIRTLLIGRMYTPSVLGYYNRGQQLPRMIVSNIDGSIKSVMLPTLSANQDNMRKVKDLMRRVIMTSSFLIFPMMIGMAVVAEPLVKVVLTDKWLPAVPFLQIFCFSYTLMPIHTANLQAINALGRSDIFLKLEVIKKVIGLIILGISLPFGVYAIALGQIVSSVVASFVNAYPNKSLLGYGYREQWMDVSPSLFIAAAMGAMVYGLGFLGFTSVQALLLQVISGIVVYLGLSWIFKIESYRYLLTTLRQLLLNYREGASA